MLDIFIVNIMFVLRSFRYNRGRDKEMSNVSGVNRVKIEVEYKVLKKYFSFYFFCGLRVFIYYSLRNVIILFIIVLK